MTALRTTLLDCRAHPAWKGTNANGPNAIVLDSRPWSE